MRTMQGNDTARVVTDGSNYDRQLRTGKDVRTITGD